VSVEAVEKLIDRKRGILPKNSDDADTTAAGAAFVDEQCSVASFDLNQPLVSTCMLNGSVLDNGTTEADVTAVAASWNSSRFAARVGLDAPVSW
jgi:hypothetical protein